MLPVNTRLFHVILLISLGLAPGMGSVSAASDSQAARLRRIILHSRHLGAHGMGYNRPSEFELSRKLTPADIPTLISLSREPDLRVGVQFALASQCDAAILPVRQAAAEHKMDFLDASDTMALISDFSGCTPEAQKKALGMGEELDRLRQEDYAKAMQEAKQQAENDARIQRNAVRMGDPNQAKNLTREEREEVFRRSLKAMGLSEDGPMTPEQKKLVDRMYRTMVLREPANPSPQ
jgi:hypothetical protein